MNLTAFSQSLILNKNGDTTVCFSINQSKFLAKEHYRAETYFKSDSICNLEIIQKDRQIKMYIKIEDKLQNIINNQAGITKLKDEEMKGLKLSLESAHKEAKKQKTYKVLSLIGGAAISGYLGYKYINK